MEKKLNTDAYNFVKALNTNDNVKAHELLEKILKDKCAKKIKATLSK